MQHQRRQVHFHAIRYDGVQSVSTSGPISLHHVTTVFHAPDNDMIAAPLTLEHAEGIGAHTRNG